MMKYCTNCGKETAEKKICEHCGVKIGKTMNFCQWCGTPLDVNAVICTNCKERKKSGSVVVRVLGYVFSVLCAILVFGSDTVVGSILFGLVAILALPFTKQMIIEATHIKRKGRKTILLIRTVLVIVLFFLASSYLPESESSDLSTKTDSIRSNQSVVLTDASIKSIVAGALIDEIGSKYRSADPGSCRFEINKIDKGSTISVYGSVTLYDKYGQITTGHSDGSGTAFRKFEVEISEKGSVRSCDIY